MSTQGTLFIVATPIGNNEDITRRATFTLQQADMVICEEAKIGARVLFNHRITKDILELNEHNEAEQTELCLEMLRQGRTLALISDCGTPLLADPGESLVAKAIAEGISVVPIPGVNSVVTGLMASGLSMNGFTFAGFLSRDPEQRVKQLTSLANETRTIALLETPYRLLPLLEAAAEVIPERKAYLGCNLTMSSETHHYGTSTELLEQFRDKKFKGEFVFCFAGLPSEAEPVQTPERWKVQQRRSGGLERDEQTSDSVGIADRPLRRRRPIETDGQDESEQTDVATDDTRNDGERSSERRSGGGERSYGGGERRSGGGERSYGGGERRSGGGERSYGGGERRSGGGERSYGGGERRSGGGERSYGGGERRSGGGERSYGGGERRSGGGERSYGGGERRSGGGERSYGGGERRSGGGERSYGGGERRSGGGERSYGGGERRSGGGERSYGGGERRSGGGERSYGGGERRSGGGERSYGGGERRSGGGERSYGGGERRSGGGERSYGGGERRSGGERSSGGGERRSGGGSRFGGGERRSGGGGSRFGGSQRRNRS